MFFTPRLVGSKKAKTRASKWARSGNCCRGDRPLTSTTEQFTRVVDFQRKLLVFVNEHVAKHRKTLNIKAKHAVGRTGSWVSSQNSFLWKWTRGKLSFVFIFLVNYSICRTKTHPEIRPFFERVRIPNDMLHVHLENTWKHGKKRRLANRKLNPPRSDSDLGGFALPIHFGAENIVNSSKITRSLCLNIFVFWTFAKGPTFVTCIFAKNTGFPRPKCNFRWIEKSQNIEKNSQMRQIDT